MTEPHTTWWVEYYWTDDGKGDGPPELVATRDFGRYRAGAYRAARDWTDRAMLDGIETASALPGRYAQIFMRSPEATIREGS